MAKEINIPNVLSTMRMLTIPLIFLLILHVTPRNYWVLITVFAFSILLDFFDGFLARKLSQETELGKILDPIADKLMVFFIVLALMIKSDFPLWLGTIIIMRDLLIMTAGWILSKKEKMIRPSILIGKITFAALSALIMVYIVDLSPNLHLPMMKRFFIVLSVGFLCWSWIEYYALFKKEKNAE
ncbi:MAG TPA: CDP-alcohol phosphatidyltransferase family protein [Candidatus Deferrimicrobium sp.]|nr:CDP-alcohol phosphatidyltransferase family protein [Candidatus Deferrimicrobium sp.]